MRIPSAGTPISFVDIWAGIKSYFSKESSIAKFEKQISELIGCKYCYMVNSGTTAFYVVLKTLRRSSKKDEVILSAYTSPSLVLPIKKLGLKPILCDVSLETFNLDVARLFDVISSRTLCIVPVHMFGIPCSMEAIMRVAGEKNIFVFEDSASSLGSYLYGKMVGAIGDAGCFSFNRGKNVSTYTGGCIMTNSESFAKSLEEELKLLEPLGFFYKLFMPFKLMALALVIQPFIYTLIYRLIIPFKSVTPHQDFHASLYTDFQAAVGLSLLKRITSFSKMRETNGSILYEGLKDREDILLPHIIAESVAVYNQFPIVFSRTWDPAIAGKEPKLRDKFYKRLVKNGIEATILYPEPLHRIYDLGYDKNIEPFPNANFLAQRLLLLPVHPLVNSKYLHKTIEILCGRQITS